MASLTQISVASRRGVRYTIYLIVLFFVGRIVLNIGTSIYKKLVPPKEPAPTVSFGKLTVIPFPDRGDQPKLSYNLQTPDGKLPKLPDQEPVYYMPPAEAGLDNEFLASQKAKDLGFNPDGKPVVENVKNIYLYQKIGIPSNLTMNIITGVFSISYDLNSDPTAVNAIPPSVEVATSIAKSNLSKAGILPQDLSDTPTSYFLNIQNGQFVKTVSLSEATITQINLFRKTYGPDNLQSVTPFYPNKSDMWFMLGGSPDSNRQVIAAEFKYYPIDDKKFGTYPLKTPQQAWDELGKGDAYIANYESSGGTNITIRRVRLAYYDPGQYSQFYQPVYVFEGDNNFFAFVPAVTSQYYGASDTQQK